MYRHIIEVVKNYEEESKGIRELGNGLSNIESIDYQQEIVSLFYKVCGPLRGTTKKTGRSMYSVLGEGYSNNEDLAVWRTLISKRHWNRELDPVATMKVLIKIGEEIAPFVTRSKSRRQALLQFVRFLRKHQKVLLDVKQSSTEKEYEIKFDIDFLDNHYRRYNLGKMKVNKVTISRQYVKFIGTEVNEDGEEHTKNLSFDLEEMGIIGWINLQPQIYMIKQLVVDYKTWMDGQQIALKKILAEANEEFSYYLIANNI